MNAGFVKSVGAFAWLEWKTLRYYPSNLLLSLTERMVNTGIWLFIGLFLQDVARARLADYGGSYVSYVVIGVAFFEAAQTALLICEVTPVQGGGLDNVGASYL